MSYYSTDITLSEKDYYVFNKFCLLKSKKGKKQLLTYRILLTIIILIFPLFFTIKDGPSNIIFAYLLLLILFQALTIPFYTLILKLHLKSLKKSGKPLYSATSHLDFCEDVFIETTPNNKTEQKYSGIERVSIYNNYIYIHMNPVLGYILPRSSFENDGKFAEFIEFIKTKCNSVDIY